MLLFIPIPAFYAVGVGVAVFAIISVSLIKKLFKEAN